MRTNRPVAVAVALLVVASATAFAAAGAPNQQTTTTVAQQETETGQDDGTEEGTETGGDDEPEATARIDFENQTTNGTSVNVTSADLSAGGFVAVYNESGVLLGVSEYLEPGEQENVTVALDVPIEVPNRTTTPDGQQPAGNETGNATVFAVAHQDTNENQQFDYLESMGEEDGPYRAGTVLVEATVTVVPDGNVTVTPEGGTATGTPEGEAGTATGTPDEGTATP